MANKVPVGKIRATTEKEDYKRHKESASLQDIAKKLLAKQLAGEKVPAPKIDKPKAFSMEKMPYVKGNSRHPVKSVRQDRTRGPK